MDDAARRPGRAGERVFLGLGSNLGRRPDHLRRALRILYADNELQVVRASFLYKTSPVGYTSQREFLNGAVEIRTRLAPAALLARLQKIERRMGKSVTFRGGPRKIDIDLLLYGKRVMRRRPLIVPHPRFHERRFALVPVAEIAPAFPHPVLKRTVARILRDCRSDERVEQWGSW